MQGWCQYGDTEELALRHARIYQKDPPPRAQWRITCTSSTSAIAAKAWPGPPSKERSR